MNDSWYLKSLSCRLPKNGGVSGKIGFACWTISATVNPNPPHYCIPVGPRDPQRELIEHTKVKLASAGMLASPISNRGDRTEPCVANTMVSAGVPMFNSGAQAATKRFDEIKGRLRRLV